MFIGIDGSGIIVKLVDEIPEDKQEVYEKAISTDVKMRIARTLYFEEVIVRDKTLVIPTKSNGIQIRGIEKLFSKSYPSIEHLNIQEGIEYIDENAINLNHLHSVSIPSSMATLRVRSFTNVETLCFWDLNTSRELKEDISLFVKQGVMTLKFKRETLVITRIAK
jgi:hypothetical protein